MLDRILGAIGRFSYRFRYVIMVFGVAVFVGVAIVQSFAGVSYFHADYNKVTDVFPEDDTLVIVYDNRDETKIKEYADTLSKNEHVTSIQSYATTLGLEMNTTELSGVTGIDETFIRTLLYISEHGTATNGMAFATFVNFLASDAFLNNDMFASKIDDDTRTQLIQTKTLVNTIALGTELDAISLATALGMDEQTVNGIFYMAGVQTMTIENFVNTMLKMAEQNPNAITPTQLAELQQLSGLVTLVKNPEPMTPNQLATAFPTQSEMLNEKTITLICIMYDSASFDTTGKTIAMYDFFNFIADSILPNETFASFFDEPTKAQMLEAKQQMADGKAQLVGAEHSRMILTLDYVIESKEMYEFYSSLESELNNKLDGDYYLVGNSAMSNELSKTFQNEYLMISIITAIAIFIIVCLTFKKFSVSLLLVCIIECAVFITMSVMAIGNIAMNFIALIIVQCILMGAMVDYGILLSNYYVEIRKEYSVDKALPEVLKRSISAIATSAIILIAITFFCGFLMKGAVASILETLCIGSLSAFLLIVFVLPSLLAIFDRFIIKKKKI